MIEYTFADIIMDPEDPRLEGAIGKECYLSDFPKIALDVARNNSTIDRLKRIAKEETCPFVNEEEESNWAVIILKKEEPKPKPKYVPFENVTEFLDAYRNAPGCLNEEDYFLSNHGIWLKDKTSKAYYMVTKICDIGDDSDEISWKELLEYYTFLDGSPCGKEVEDE